MSPEGLALPSPKMLDYPGAIWVAIIVVFASILLVVTGRFDPTGGTLTISFLVLLLFAGLLIFSLVFVVPSNEITASIIGGLIGAVGAVISFWLSRGKGPP